MTRPLRLPRPWLLLAAAFVAGCGERQPPPASQVVARVNGEDVTVHQLNQVLARAPGAAAGPAEGLRHEVLQRLIEQQLLQQQALARKLDRSPGVMQAIDAARSEILAQAWRERVAAAQPEPSPEEVKRYYAERPELFAQRRVFSLEEIVAPSRPGLAEALREQLARPRTMAELAAWLQSKGVRYAEQRGERPAEHLPLELLPQLQEMRVGELRALETGGRVHLVRLVSVQAAPVDEASAAPRIRQFLANQRLAAALARELAELRERSRIEYLGDFAGAAAAADKPAPARGAAAGPDVHKAVRALR